LLIKIFPTTPKAHSNFPEIFSEEIIQYSRTFAATSTNLMKPKAHALLLIENFPKI